MKASLNITLGLLGAASMYMLFYYPVGYIILTAAIATVCYVLTMDLAAPLGAVIFMIVLRWLGTILQPVSAKRGNEGFQDAAGPNTSVAPKDVLTIHQRITKQKAAAAPKVSEPTGVLESPKILGSYQVGSVLPEEEGFTNSTLPANANGPVTTIPTPAESSVPQNVSPDAAPMSNPALITGEDTEAVDTAMTAKGSALNAAPLANTGAMMTGAAPYE